MAGKISELDPASDIVGAEVEILQGGVNLRAGAGLFTRELRRNTALQGMYQAKSFGAYRRGLNTIWDGFADSSGINAGRSDGYEVDTDEKLIRPTETGGNDSFVKLLIHADGSDGSTTFTDDSATGHTVTTSGSAQVDTAQSKFGGASALFAAGGSDYLAVADHPEFDIGTGDFTVDLWFRINAFTPGTAALFD